MQDNEQKKYWAYTVYTKEDHQLNREQIGTN